MESRVIVHIFSNLKDKDVLLNEAVELGQKLARQYERIDSEAKENKKLVGGPYQSNLLMGQDQNVLVLLLLYNLFDQPSISPPISLPPGLGRA
jgi:hypothetical protein